MLPDVESPSKPYTAQLFKEHDAGYQGVATKVVDADATLVFDIDFDFSAAEKYMLRIVDDKDQIIAK